MTLSGQAATGCADREVVAAAFGWVRTEVAATDYWPDLGPSRWSMWCRAGEPYVETAPDYQNDLPATLAEIERRGWRYGLDNRTGPWAIVWKTVPPAGSPGTAIAEGTTIAHAACAAHLQALEQQP
jgi:hypothetical protein